MKGTRNPRRQVMIGLGLAGLGSLAGRAAADGQDASTLPNGESFPLGGTVGLLGGQAARLSVVHHHHGKELPPICNIVADVVGADGKVLASGKFGSLGPNEARFLDFVHPGTRGRPADSRIEIFGRVRYTPGHQVGATLEILDDSKGASMLAVAPCGIEDPALGGQAGDPWRVPLLAPGTAGFVRGQFLRVSMIHYVLDKFPPICNLVAEVFDAQGKLYATRKFANPGANQAVFLDVPHPGGPGAARDTRFEVMVNVRHTPGHDIGSSAQVVDLATGVTALMWPPICNTPDPTL